MSTPKFTPGPWRYQEMSDAYTHIVRGPNNEFILYGPQSSSAEVEADIRLAAAAPEMYEALLMVMDRAALDFSDAQIDQIDAAIAKAEGKQP